jgi:hypothetical protein
MAGTWTNESAAASGPAVAVLVAKDEQGAKAYDSVVIHATKD